jgi:hypothetical protein
VALTVDALDGAYNHLKKSSLFSRIFSCCSKDTTLPNESSAMAAGAPTEEEASGE